MIQDIAPHKLKNTFDPEARPKSGDCLIYYHKGEMAAELTEDRLDFPRAGAREKDLPYLFSIDDTAFFLASEEPKDCAMHPMKEFRNRPLLPKEYVFAAFTAMHLAEWYQHHRFCGCCASVLQHSKTERAMVCPSCGEVYYPRINPAVIVGVKKGDCLLLTKYRRGFSQNALIAGFTEIGETLEETCAREVMEETGIRIKNIRYYKSQPWGVASDLLTGFLCEAEGDDEIRPDTSELKEARWVPREEIELQAMDYSLTNEIMAGFKNGIL